MSAYEQTGSDADLKAIERVRDAHIAAFNAGDAASYAAQFGDDAVHMPPNSPETFSKEWIEHWAKEFFKVALVELAVSAQELHVLRDWAFERGDYTARITTKGTDISVKEAGKYITIYQRNVEGTWQIARYIWNSSDAISAM